MICFEIMRYRSGNTFKNKYTATKYWSDYLHTPTAKAKLIRFIKCQEKEVYIQK